MAKSRFVDTVEDGRNTAASKTRKITATFRHFLTSSPVQIWKSRLSWRITLAVFMTILAVQVGILSFTIKDYEAERLSHLREIGRAAIAALIETAENKSLLSSPLTDTEARRLISSTPVNGLTVYSPHLDLIKTFGEPLSLTLLNSAHISESHRSPSGNSYETVYRANDLGKPYIIAARLNSSAVQQEVMYYVRNTILIMLLMSAFVTSVLMVAMGYWLLEPILFMRNNLLRASENPENPNISPSPFNPNDEIGQAIEIAQNLIHQNARNIKQIKNTAEDKIHKLAYYDKLTGLPNRTLFLQTLAENTRVSEGEDTQRLAVIALDIDHFKDINDSMGHNVGDAILRGIGQRLRSALPEAATVSRSGEDEFAIMMPLTKGMSSARDIAERVQGVVRSQPFRVFDEQFQIRASVGVATFPDDGTDPDQVLKNADIALNRAKEEGRDKINEYSEDFDRAVQQRFQMLRDLRDALEHDQLSLHFQPQLDLRTGEIIGAEALIRWWKPDHSKGGGRFISPVEFIPIAEQSGLIVPIGEWVMDQACRAAKIWEKEHGFAIRIAVNVSAAQFSQSDLCDFVRKTIQKTGLKPNRLELEVTESVFMDDIHHTVDTLKTLNEIGVELAIDDFGTGYSSLSYLRQFPIDRLKIDQSFIKNALNDRDDAAIARTIIGLGRSLNLRVIAEGVETKDHEEFLRRHGCDEVQGYRYARPAPSEDFITFVKGYNGRLSSFN